ncbi:MAG: type II toxin-antitoxin system VapC family toxin [Desulfococcaceae bacterium]|nr:type II toxin-antitoxin system VapC family toxin [Desulfococcaceae bacterium]
MILLDTHIWLWQIDQNKKLKNWQRNLIEINQDIGLGVSIFSCWEVAKLVEPGRITFGCGIDEWMENALAYDGIQLIDLTPQIVIDSTCLPGNFHKDPADQIIVATARCYDIPLLTSDEKILAYQYVKLCKENSVSA